MCLFLGSVYCMSYIYVSIFSPSPSCLDYIDFIIYLGFSTSVCWAGRPGVLRFMGSQSVGHDQGTELNRTELMIYIYESLYLEVCQPFNFVLLQYPIDPCGSFFSPCKLSKQLDRIEQISCWDFNWDGARVLVQVGEKWHLSSTASRCPHCSFYAVRLFCHRRVWSSAYRSCTQS